MDDEGVEPSLVNSCLRGHGQYGERGAASAEDTENGQQRWPDPESIAYALLVI